MIRSAFAVMFCLCVVSVNAQERPHDRQKVTFSVVRPPPPAASPTVTHRTVAVSSTERKTLRSAPRPSKPPTKAKFVTITD